MDDLTAKVEEARNLRDEDELEASQEILLALLEQYPDNATVLYEVGGSYDVLGEERDAIPYYEQAVDAGLEGDDLQECLICLGSCNRVIGEFEESVEALETAVSQFPDNKSGHVFLALAYYSNDQKEDAMRTLMELLLETTQNEDILAYADVLEFYKDHLEEVWDEE
ncbi:MAG: tetratricopeptide repeat protein [Anaerolineae bacterium]|nr:tetratricopeptide repeat protein [Anaerolineae bacterium]